jgi:hypothetical protein
MSALAFIVQANLYHRTSDSASGCIAFCCRNYTTRRNQTTAVFASRHNAAALLSKLPCGNYLSLCKQTLLQNTSFWPPIQDNFCRNCLTLLWVNFATGQQLSPSGGNIIFCCWNYLYPPLRRPYIYYRANFHYRTTASVPDTIQFLRVAELPNTTLL